MPWPRPLISGGHSLRLGLRGTLANTTLVHCPEQTLLVLVGFRFAALPASRSLILEEPIDVARGEPLGHSGCSRSYRRCPRSARRSPPFHPGKHALNLGRVITLRRLSAVGGRSRVWLGEATT